jgi:hypothetical protein
MDIPSADLNIQEFAQGLAHPGMDPRVWISYGTVDLDTDDQKAVEFDEDGAGPSVSVTLHPSEVSLRCRVLGAIAGNGEADYSPIIEGEEVLVAVPSGDFKAIPVIIGRLNNTLDKFPEYVVGKETKLNNIGFRRQATPFVIEVGGDSGSWMVRCEKTGALIGIDNTGNLLIRDGEGAVMSFGPSGWAVQGPDNGSVSGSTMQISLDTTNKQISLFFKGGAVSISETDVKINAPGRLLVSTSGVPIAAQHVVTLEQLYVILKEVLTKTTMVAANPTGGALLDPVTVIPVLQAALLMASTSVITPPEATALNGLLLGSTYLGAPIGGIPGVGCAGFCCS